MPTTYSYIDLLWDFRFKHFVDVIVDVVWYDVDVDKIRYSKTIMLYLFEYDFAHLSSFHAIHSISEIINIFIFSVIQKSYLFSCRTCIHWNCIRLIFCTTQPRTIKTSNCNYQTNLQFDPSVYTYKRQQQSVKITLKHNNKVQMQKQSWFVEYRIDLYKHCFNVGKYTSYQ